MKNAISATIFDTLINLALVTFKNNGHNKLNTVLRDGVEGLIIKFSSLKWSDCVMDEWVTLLVKFVISRTLVNPKSRTRFNF